MSSFDDYDILGEIGRGTYGHVYKAQLKGEGENREVLAIKKIDFTKASSKELEHLRREESILKNLCDQRHENIVRYVASFATESVLYVVTEHCPGGSLHDYLRQVKTGLDEQEFKIYLEQILNGVKYLHSKNITHRDLKTKNILLTSDSRIKIADFGVAKEQSGRQVTTNTVYVGTLHYIAPEMADGRGVYDEKVDIWAIGCDCYEMGTSKYAFEGRNGSELMEAVKRNQLPSMNNLRFCDTLQEMIVRMLAFDPAKRPDAATLYDEISRHRCQNLNPPQTCHKTTQVFAHSTAVPGPNGKGVFLSSLSTISQDTGQGKEPMQNTDSFDNSGGHVTLDVSRSLSRDFNGKKQAWSGVENTDSFASFQNSSHSPAAVYRSVSRDSMKDGRQNTETRSRKSSSSSMGDSSYDIGREYQRSLDKFDKLLYSTLIAEGGRDVQRQLGALLLEEGPREQFTEQVEAVLGERFAWLRTLVLTVKNLEDGVREYANK